MFILKLLKKLLFILYAIAVATTLAFIFIEKFLFETWAELTSDEIIYHILAPLKGTDTSLIYKCLSTYTPIWLTLLIVWGIIHYLLKNNKKAFRRVIAFFLATTLFLLGTTFYDIESKSHIISYINSSFALKDNEDFILDNYISPKDVKITFPNKPRNLIYIFLESMETTYADTSIGGAFPQNVIPELSNLALEGECFSGDSSTINGAYSLPGTNWTVAGMFAQSSGIPIKLSVSSNESMDADSFLPTIDATGDILENHGYKNYLLLGSDAAFGGRDALYTEHGSATIHDIIYMKENGRLDPNYEVFWGYEDNKLFNYAKEDLTEISQNDEPFMYTLLTVDTHFEDGYVCEDCENKFGDNQYANVFACSSSKVAEFINWIKEQDFYENTTIILAGDHTTMDADFCNNVSPEYQRKTYYTILNSPASKKLNEFREYSVLDLFPTSLAAIGAKIEGNRLGLGANLYSTEKTLAEILGKEELFKKMEQPSNFFKVMNENLSEESIEDTLNEIKNSTLLGWWDDGNGLLHVKLDKVRYFTRDAIKRVYLVAELTNGETKLFDMSRFDYNPNHPKGYYFEVDTDIPVDVAVGGTLKAYMSFEEIKDFNICTAYMEVVSGPLEEVQETGETEETEENEVTGEPEENEDVEEVGNTNEN